jgi:2-octaprenyl-6-methoxyphenol hydroxylase
MAKDGTADSDLLIVGGGLVGQTMAIAAAVAGLTVVLVDREPPAGQLAEPYDGRSSAIARGSQQALEGLGIWPLMADRTQPITDIRVSDGRAGPLGETGWAATLFLDYG